MQSLHSSAEECLVAVEHSYAYRLSSEPDSSIPPSSDQESAFTQLLRRVSNSCIHSSVSLEVVRCIPYVTVLSSAGAEDLDAIQLVPVHPVGWTSTSETIATGLISSPKGRKRMARHFPTVTMGCYICRADMLSV